MHDKFMGADFSFNRNWSAVVSITKVVRRKPVIIGYQFSCGCGHETDYLNKKFVDSHAAAVTAVEYHRCVEPNPIALENNVSVG